MFKGSSFLIRVYLFHQEMTLRKLFQAPANGEGSIREEPIIKPRGKLKLSMAIDESILENAIVNQRMADLRLKADDLPMVEKWE